MKISEWIDKWSKELTPNSRRMADPEYVENWVFVEAGPVANAELAAISSSQAATSEWVNESVLRADVFRAYGGPLRGGVACVVCGARLCLDCDNAEQMCLVRVDSRKRWIPANCVPTCASCAEIIGPSPEVTLRALLRG